LFGDASDISEDEAEKKKSSEKQGSDDDKKMDSDKDDDVKGRQSPRGSGDEAKEKEPGVRIVIINNFIRGYSLNSW